VHLGRQIPDPPGKTADVVAARKLQPHTPLDLGGSSARGHMLLVKKKFLKMSHDDECAKMQPF
jgi:hypothetical protein